MGNAITAGFRIQDPLKAKSGLANVTEFLYKELQYALRAAVGAQTLDALLENKGAVDTKRKRIYLHQNRRLWH